MWTVFWIAVFIWLFFGASAAKGFLKIVFLLAIVGMLILLAVVA